MDENMTEHLVNVQQQALQLAMIVQRIEDGQNSAAGQSGMSFYSLHRADPFSDTGCLKDSRYQTESDEHAVEQQQGSLSNFLEHQELSAKDSGSVEPG